MYLVLLSVCLVSCGNVRSEVDSVSTEPSVTSPAGSFIGSLMETRRGRRIYAFRGVRYAEPPIGVMRFKPPKLITKYSGVVNATADGPACPQPGLWLDQPNEDCLILNVYTATLPGRNPGNNLSAVLVYFHPGGFYSVSSQSFINGPQYLLEHDIVLVTVNYRLGALGFISTGDRWAPGNNGLKDQVAALRWIQQNIASFGGDPNQVTIFGYSAGSMSVTLHMLSPMSKGLFHRAIAMSATATAQWPIPSHQLDLAIKQARILGCYTPNGQRTIQCLRATADANDIGNSLPKFYEFADQSPVLIWTPVVEPDVGEERFLTEQPVKLIKEGKINDVPLIIGMTELEFAGQAFTLLLNKTNTKKMEDNWNDVAPIAFQYERGTPRSTRASQELKKFYLGDRKLRYNNDTAFSLGKLYGDGVISFGVHRFANLMADHLKSPIYYYKFNYTGDMSHVYYPNTKTPIGAVHHDDLLYLFRGSRYFQPISLDSPHSHMVDKMTTMWTNFAIHGNPNPTGHQPVLGNLNWPVMTSKERKYLQINSDFSVRSNMFEERFRLWDSLFPISE